MLDKTNIQIKRKINVKIKIEFMNWITKLLTKIFPKFSKLPSEEITAKNCDLLDNIWIKQDDQVYSGFIYAKTRRRILVSYCKNDQFFDEYFVITNLPDDAKIQKNNLTLYFKKPCFTD